MRESRTNIGTFLTGLMLLVLLTPNLAPLTSATDGARANADFSVQSITLDGAGSVWDGVDLILEPEQHIIRVVVSNTGSAAGQVTLNIVHRGSPVANSTIVTSIDLGSMAASSTSNPILISWDATTGDGQSLFARVASSTDSNSANNEQRLDFNVSIFHSGAVTGDTIPAPIGGQSTARLTNAIHPVNATVLNQGVMAMSAALELSFYEVLNPGNTFTVWSNTLTLEPGSIFNPATADTLTVNLDATTITGIWNLTATVHFNGTAYTDPQLVSEVDVEFSNYVAELASPADRTTEPGMQTTLTFILKNTGSSSDSFSIGINDVLGWADMSLDGSSTAVISPDATTTVQIGVSVPISASRSEVESITLTLTSIQASYSLTGFTRVMSGEFYSALVTMPAIVTMVTPGQEVELSVQIENNGNVPTSFNLVAGLGVAANNWTVSLSTPTTALVNDGSTVTVVLTVVVPPIQLPLDLSEYNRAGDSLSVWVQAQAAGGGMPTTDSSAVEVRPVIVVDPGLPTEHIDLTVQDVIAAKNGMGLDEILGLSVEVRHNLVTDLSETVDASITVGTITFVADNTGGFSEAPRWTANVSPSLITGLALGEIQAASFGIQGPADDYPLAGTIIIPITATPTLGGVHAGSGVIATEVTRNLSITIPQILDAEILEQGPLDAEVGILTDFYLNLANTGNDLTSYRLSIVDNLPDNWTATLNTTTSTSNIIDNLSANVADYPLFGTEHIAGFTLSVTTDPQTPADLDDTDLQTLSIRIEERDTGLFIGTHTIEIRVGEMIDASLSPTNQSVDMSGYENPLTRVKISNTGNAPTNFNIWLDSSDSTEVNFTLESPTLMLIAAGYESSVKIRITPGADASSDEFYMATLWVSTESGLNLSANIVANISEEHLLQIDAPSQVGVVPGTDQDVTFNLTNVGNLAETVNVDVSVEGNWTVTPFNQQLVLPIDAAVDGIVNVAVPSLGGSDELLNGAIHNMTITVSDSVTGATLGVRSIELVVGALFLVEEENWPDVMEYHRQWVRTWDVLLTNTGNEDVTVAIEYDIFQPGLTINSSEWELWAEMSPTVLTLPRQSAVPFTFQVNATQWTPLLTLAADLIVTLTPIDSSIEGTAVLTTTLKMSRFFETTPATLRPAADDGPMQVNLTYSHIPDGPSTIVAYELEVCSAVRLFNMDDSNLNPEDYIWNFSINVDSTIYEIPLNASCASGTQGNTSRISLPPRAAWDTTAPIKVFIDAPDRPNILPGDGYDLTFRLYHPDEHTGYSIYTEETFTFALDVYSDPLISAVTITEGELIEGTDAIMTVTVYNGGTALALGVTVNLECDNLFIKEYPAEIFLLGPNSEETLTFIVRSENLDWWAQSIPVKCTATLDGTMMHNNIEANDVHIYEGTVDSFSWGLSISFIATVVLLIISLFLINLSSKNEKMRLVAVYTGVAALGFAFHIGQAFSLSWWGPAILVITALWVWRMTWSSSEEFRLIHEDYQRARRGVSTMYADHFEALGDGRRQLSLILALPIFGMMAIVLGIPPQMASNRTNLISLVVYMAVVMIGVWFLLAKSDKMYGNLFGRLTDVEVKATRIERDLGDPARLLNELAVDGLDLTTIFEGVSSTSTVSDLVSEGNTDEGVNDDV